jgi:rhodanese-related sulfurtransferase
VHPHQLPTADITELEPARAAGALILDVREDAEWDAGRLEGSEHVVMHEVPAWLAGRGDQLPPTIVVCRSGHRSAHVTAWLREQGVDARNLDGGLLAWAVARRPLVTDDGRDAYVA